MATFQQIKLLIQAHFNNDNNKFKTVALQIAANEARKGHNKSAKEIKDIIDKEYRDIRIDKINNNNVSNSDIDELITIYPANVKLNNIIVNNEIEDKINEIISEHNNFNLLYRYGLNNKRKLLLFGPPGTGKTTTASVLAKELNLPLYIVNLDSIVTKYLGESNTKLRKVFDIIAFNKGVYLFDEFDAIAGDRSRDNDVGEMRRVVNTFLQLLENDTSTSLIIAATNNKILLDKALFRRFDEIIHYNLPEENEIKLIIINIIGEYISRRELKKLDYKNYLGLSHSEITVACKDALKKSILNKIELTSTLLNSSMNNRKAFYYGNEE